MQVVVGRTESTVRVYNPRQEYENNSNITEAVAQ